MKYKCCFAASILMLACLTLTACEQGDEILKPLSNNEPGANLTDINHGAMHNQFLELMPYGATPTSDQEVIALSTESFYQLLAEKKVPRADIEQVLRQVNYMVADLLNQGIMRLQLDAEHPTPFDSERLAEYLVVNEIISPRDFNLVLEFIMDVQFPGSSKSAMDYDAVAQKWDNKQVIPASVLGIMQHSNQFWHLDKKRPSTNAEIVVYDTVGGLLGLIFGPAGSVLGAGYCSYVAAIYCTDPSCRDGGNKNLIGNPGPVRDFRNTREQMSSIFNSQSEAGFSAGMNTQQKCISVGVVLSLLVLAGWRKRFKNESLAALGLVIFFITICLMIGTREFSFLVLAFTIGGLLLVVFNLKRNHNTVAN